MSLPANSNFKILKDQITPFSLDNISVTGRFMRTSKMITDILDRHQYPESVARLLGEALMVISLIGSGLKLRHRLILQIQGDGAVPLIVAEYTSENTMRGYADINKPMFERWTGGEDINPFLLLGKGHVALTIDNGKGTKPYQGIVPIEGESLSNVILGYIERSDQIMSCLKLHLEHMRSGDQMIWKGAAMILQKLGHSTYNTQSQDSVICPADDQEEEDWSHAKILFQTLTDQEMLQEDISEETILYRLFNNEEIRVFNKNELSFACSCHRDKLENFLLASPEKDLREMSKNNKIIADCQFCKVDYIFDIDDILTKQKML